MFNKSGKLSIDNNLKNQVLKVFELLSINYNEAIILDIETTGFSPKNSLVYLIGTSYYYNNNFHYNMDLALPQEEKVLLEKFITTLSSYKYIITFNGNMFDLRFLKERMAFYKINFDYENYVLLDLYKELKKYKNLLNLKSCKLGDFYNFIYNKQFNDKDGGQCISVYKNMLKDISELNSYLEILYEHNFLDLLKTTSIITLLELSVLKNAHINYFSSYVKNNTFYVNFTVDFYLNIDKTFNCFRLIINHGKGVLITFISKDITPMYLSPIKDYLFLISENRAIPKSIGKFMDKSQVLKCTKENCFTPLNINDNWINNKISVEKFLIFNFKYIIENI